MNTNFNIDLLATDEPQEQPIFIYDELNGELDTDDYEYQQSTQY